MTITYAQFAQSPVLPPQTPQPLQYFTNTFDELPAAPSSYYDAVDTDANDTAHAHSSEHNDAALSSAQFRPFNSIFTLSESADDNTSTIAPYAPLLPSLSSSSTSTVSSSRHRLRGVAAADPRVQRQRNVKHNEAEIRRRQRLNGILSELALIVGCDRPYKSAILRTALETVKTLQARLAEANAEIEKLTLSAAPSPITSPRLDVRELMGASCVAMHIADLNGAIVDCNELFALFSGFERRSLLSGTLSLINIIAHSSLTEYLALSTRLVTNIHSVQRIECNYQCAHGVVRAAALISWMASTHNKSFVVSIVHPVKTISNAAH